jgi:hypothetical protein
MYAWLSPETTSGSLPLIDSPGCYVSWVNSLAEEVKVFDEELLRLQKVQLIAHRNYDVHGSREASRTLDRQ